MANAKTKSVDAVKGSHKTSAHRNIHKGAKTAYAVRGKTGSQLPKRSPNIKTSVRTGGAEVIEFDLQNANQLPSIEKIGLIRKGFSKEQLEDIKDEADLDYETLSSLLAVSRATLLKKKGAEKFDQSTSERIMLLADLISYGQDVFEDKNQFNSWLKKPNKAFDMKTPLEIMDTLYGMEEVKKELGRIEYGIF